MSSEIQDFKREAVEQDRQDDLHEKKMRSDIDYFFGHSGLDEVKEALDKLHKKTCDYGWVDDPKDFL